MINWHSSVLQLTPTPPDNLIPWLQEKRPLSQQYRQKYKNITLQLLQQKRSEADIDAAERLNIIDNPKALVREIVLFGDQQPLSYAKVTIPLSTYMTYQKTFDHLGEKLIGEAFLYTQNNLSRSDFEYAVINDLQQAPNWDVFNNHYPLYTRRSVFAVDAHPLLIQEVFLFSR